MELYKELYFRLFNAMTTAVDQLMRLDSVAAIDTLMDAQLETEERYIEAS